MGAASRPCVEHHYQSALMDSRRWESFKPRAGDIVISTSYKAGTTWMQGICAALVFQAPRPPASQDELSPWLDALFAPLDAVLATLEGLTSRRYIKTHLPLDALPFHDKVKYIFVGRDGRDVFMSLWNHWNNLQPAFIDQLNDAPGTNGPRLHHPPVDLRAAFDEWLSKGSFEWEEDGYPFWSHLHHARTWWEHRALDNVCHVHYADLNADLDGEMRRISAYLGIPVNEAIWPDLVRGTTFAEMKANATKLVPGATQGLWKDTANFFHRGTNRRWVGRLTQEQSDRYERLAARRLAPALNRWLDGGRRVAGDPKQI